MELGFVVGVCVDQRRPKRIKSVVSGRLGSVGVSSEYLRTLNDTLDWGGPKEFGDFSSDQGHQGLSPVRLATH